MTGFASRMSRVAPSAIMELLKTAAAGGYVNFASGLPAADLFPHETLRAIADDILTNDWRAALQYGAAEGYAPLRELVAERLQVRGLRATVDNVLITSGSQQAIDLGARLFLNQGDTVVIESPTYLAALQTFDSYEVRYESAPLDAEGVDEVQLTAALRSLDAERQRGLLFALPNFQNPTGITLMADRRLMIAECAAMLMIPVLEDDAYYDLRYEGEHLPPLAALAANPFALYTGTFSKTIAPGIRVGWIYGGREVIARLAQLKQIADLHSGSLTQRMAFEFCARGHLEPQIARICEAYRKNRDVMFAALDREMPEGVRWTKPQGGMFTFVELPNHLDGDELLRCAMEEKIMFVPGRSFFPPDPAEPDAGRNTLRLNFVSPTSEEIDRGIALLARLIRS